MAEKILKATHQGKLTIGDKELNCAVLEDGTRIFSNKAVFNAFDRPDRGKVKGRVTSMPSFIDAKNLQPYVSDDLVNVISHKVLYQSKGGKIYEGYNVEIIPLLCDTYLAARLDGVLTQQQQKQAAASEILVRSLSKVGILALVDEATGYQEERDRDELQKILAHYIRSEFMPWTKRFPDEFYKQMFRLKNWEYKGNPKPPIVGKLTNYLVYDQLPDGVLNELQNINPIDKNINRRKFKHHQFLTEITGIPHLDKHLASLISLMRISDSWNEFEKNFKKAFNISYQIELNLDDYTQS